MSDWNFLNKYRVGHGVRGFERYGSTPDYGFNGLFRFRMGMKQLRVVASEGEGWKHVSVSIEGENTPPKWDTMCAVKDLFWESEDCVVQFHPPRSEYVNFHPGCLHLWQPIDQPFPTPPSIMVGPKS